MVAEFGETRCASAGYVGLAGVSVDKQTRTIDVSVRVPEPFSAGVPAGAATATGGTPPLPVGTLAPTGSAPGP